MAVEIEYANGSKEILGGVARRTRPIVEVTVVTVPIGETSSSTFDKKSIFPFPSLGGKEAVTGTLYAYPDDHFTLLRLPLIIIQEILQYLITMM